MATKTKAPAHVNQMSKARKYGKNQPYLRFEAGGWRWDVLKSYQGDNGKLYARWFCEVSSPYTMGGSDLGDTYVAEVIRNGVLVYADPSIDLDVLAEQIRMAISPAVARTPQPVP